MSSTDHHITDAHRALHSPWHMACIRGADVGTILVPRLPSTVGTDAPSRLRDRSVSAHHVRIHAPSTFSQTVSSQTRHPRPFSVFSRWRRPPLAMLEDLHSAGGTRVRAFWFLPWTQCRPGHLYSVAAGSEVRLGDEVFEVRMRPHTLRWPRPAMVRSRLAWGLVPMGVFVLWRCLMFPGLWWVPLLMGCVGACYLLYQQGLWSREDAAFLALVCASLTGESISPDGASTRQVTTSFRVWPHRPRPRHAYQQIVGSAEGAGKRDIRYPGFIGEYAHLAALWWVAQVAVQCGGVLVEFPGGERRKVGAARLSVRIVENASFDERMPPHEGAGADLGEGSLADVMIGVGRSYGELPPWCTHILYSRGAPASPLWWEQVSSPYDEAQIPSYVAWEELFPADKRASGELLPLSPDGEIASRRDFSTPLGKNASGVVEVDLLAEGPHALLVGTTGSGKSEALRTWLLGLCTRASPRDLRLVLVDYKGGATFRPLTPLPHVECLLTDLEPEATARALVGLSTHLTQRERQLSEYSFADLAEWERAWERQEAPVPPPRILVVIDEFQVLSQLHSQALETVNRLAAQGRSLGMHALYATQRPSGAISGQMRANTDLRLSLRTLTVQDSRDVIDVPDAAFLPRLPGRAILPGTGEFQCAHCADYAGVVSRIRSRYVFSPLQTRLWPPPLPSDVSWEDLRALHVGSPGEGSASFPLGVIDGLRVGGHYPLVWRGEHILFLGPRSSRAKLQGHAYAVASALASQFERPLHVCSTHIHARRYSGVLSDPADIVTLWEELAHASPRVVFIDDEEQLRESLTQRMGALAAERVWNSFIRLLDLSTATLVSAAPGRTNPVHDHGIYRMRFIDVPDERVRMAAGFPSSTPLTTAEHVFVRVEDSSVCLLPHIPLFSASPNGSDQGQEAGNSPFHPLVSPDSLCIPWALRRGEFGEEHTLPRASEKKENSHLAKIDTGEKGFPSPVSSGTRVAPITILNTDAHEKLLYGPQLIEFSSPFSDFLLIGEKNSLVDQIFFHLNPHAQLRWLSLGEWLRCRDHTAKNILFVNPSRDITRVIFQNFPQAPFSLLAHEWDQRSGILIHHQQAFRFHIQTYT